MAISGNDRFYQFVGNAQDGTALYTTSLSGGYYTYTGPGNYAQSQLTPWHDRNDPNGVYGTNTTAQPTDPRPGAPTSSSSTSGGGAWGSFTNAHPDDPAYTAMYNQVVSALQGQGGWDASTEDPNYWTGKIQSSPGGFTDSGNVNYFMGRIQDGPNGQPADSSTTTAGTQPFSYPSWDRTTDER